MNTATIKLYLAFGDPKRLRTGEISNWSGKAVAAPRTDLDELLGREELKKPGVYILVGTDSDKGTSACYVGEAEILKERLRQHRDKDFWVHAIVVVSKDENLTKSHIRYLEGRLISDARDAGRFEVVNLQASGARLSESDREEMEVFPDKVRQLLPVLGSDILTPRPRADDSVPGPTSDLVCEIKGLKAYGRRTADGFIIFAGSQAVRELRPSADTPMKPAFCAGP
ncbi:MAG: GIY-YIG nuclease family protein [Proteobacteria bacterium]|nr:GIY-YIG nuclease family protein [Pseudomonadota bacterium]